jgi:hypothetical protein
MTDADQVEFLERFIELDPGLEKKAGQTAADVICEAFDNARAQLEDLRQAATHVVLDDLSPGAIDATLRDPHEAEQTQHGARDGSLNAVGDTSGTRLDGDESLGDSARRALNHIRGRTRQAAFTFANQLWDMPDKQWTAALEQIRNAGYEIYWTRGTVADEPTVTGGWRLDATREGAAAAEPVRLAQIAQPDPMQDAFSEPSARAHPLLNEHGSYTAKTFEVIDRLRSAIGRGDR